MFSDATIRVSGFIFVLSEVLLAVEARTMFNNSRKDLISIAGTEKWFPKESVVFIKTNWTRVA